MIDFRPISINDRDLYQSFFTDNRERGCEYNFANLIMWGQQSISVVHGNIVRLAHFGGHTAYAFPVGDGSKKDVLNTIMADAHERNIPCVFTGVYEEDKATLEELYPNRFRFISNRDGFDYVYDINDLADLKGRKYHSKRNHLHRFRDEYPNYTVEPIDSTNLHLAKELALNWYEAKLEADPQGDFDMEQEAIERVFKHYSDLQIEGLLLKNGDEVLSFTMGSRMSEDTFDVHFEKARAGKELAYAAINNEFARYIRNKYPHIKFLDREEDMGLEGLRKAKESYRPHHLIEKFRAVLAEVEYEN